MYAYQSYAVGGVALYGFCRYLVVPLLQEPVNAGGVVGHVVGEVVEESAYVWCLSYYGSNIQAGVELLCQLVEWQREQLLSLVVEFGSNVGCCRFFQEGLCQRVVGMCEQSHGGNDDANRRRCTEAEGLVAHYAHFRHVLGEVPGNDGY